jgi:ubiquitin-activating enzyme E1
LLIDLNNISLGPDINNYYLFGLLLQGNLRSDNYYIKNADFNKVKLVAGRIIPAIATTTASVCGLVLCELFKVVQGFKADKLRQRLIGLAVNNYTSFEADPPKKLKSGETVTKPDAAGNQ